MNAILTVLKREYRQRVRSKAFLFGTLMTPVLMVAWVTLPATLARLAGGEREVTILDQSGDPGLASAFERHLAAQPADPRLGAEPPAARIKLSRREVAPGESLDAVRRGATPGNSPEPGYLLLPAGVLEDVGPEYHAANVNDPALDTLSRALSAAVVERRLVSSGLDPERAARHIEPVPLKKVRITASGTAGGGDETVALIMLITLYATTLLYGVSVMKGVAEEKRSRIVELMLASIRPFQMMWGKLLGIGLVGLTQYAIWVAAVILIAGQGIGLPAGGNSLPDIPLAVLAYFVLYFVLGYFLFGTLYALIGAMVSSEEDAPQLQMPVTMLIVVPVFMFWMVVRDPGGATSVAVSLIPFFAPTLMMVRLVVSDPPLWQVVTSIALMLASIAGALWLAARVYRVAILMYGKRLTLPELMRWLRYA